MKSCIKESSKKLKTIAKKYGYEIKHTHALEIMSQLNHNVNRHVALKKEINKRMIFDLKNQKYALDIPFFKSHVIKLNLKHSDTFHIYITNSIPNMFEDLLDFELNDEIILEIESFELLQEKDLDDKVNWISKNKNGTTEYTMTIKEAIFEKHKECGLKSFSLFHHYE